jgi:hypothetical protein
MNIKKTIHSIQQGKFSLLLNFLILFFICNLALHGIGVVWLELSSFSIFEKILFPIYFIFTLYFSFITTLGAWKSGNYYVQENKKNIFKKYLSIPIKLIIIFWTIKIVNTFAVFIFLFFDKI